MRLISLYLFLVTTVTATFAGAPEVAELLATTAARYARIQDYRIEVRHSRTGRLLSGRNESGPAAGAPSPIVAVMTLTRSGPTFRLEVGPAGDRRRTTWVDDGTTCWHYTPISNEYIQRPADPWPTTPGPAPGLSGQEWTYFLKFRALAGMAKDTRLLKANVPADSDCPHDSVLLDMALSKEDGIHGEMRIDKTTGLVCRLEVRSVDTLRTTSSSWVTVDVWKYVQIEGNVPPEQLAFVPPKNARSVKKFSRPPRDSGLYLPELKQ